MKSLGKRVRGRKQVKKNQVFGEPVGKSPEDPPLQIQDSQKIERISSSPPPPLPHNSQKESSRDECDMEEATEEGPQMFEELCDRMLSALGLLESNVSEILDVKDALLLQNVPSSLQAQLSLSASRLFRSMLDLQVPSTELVRLVRLYGPQWEQKRQILNQLQGEHEKLRRLLSLALRRVQNLEAQTQSYKYWEEFSAQLPNMVCYETSQISHCLDLKSTRGQTEIGNIIKNEEGEQKPTGESHMTQLSKRKP